MWHSFLTPRISVLAGRRTTGAGTNYFALVIIHTLCSTFGSSGSPNSVRPPPLSPAFCVIFFQTAALLRSCLCVLYAPALVFVVQDNLYGPVMPATHAPLHMPSESLVCSFSPSWRCTAGGNWRKTAAISKPSCTAMTRKPSSSLTSSGELYSTWFGTMLPDCQRCRREWHREEPPEVVEDPFLAVREHLAAVDSAFRNLQPQVLTVVAYSRDFVDARNIECAFGRCCCSFPSCSWTLLQVHKFCCSLLIQPTFRWLSCDPRPSNLLFLPALVVYALIRQISSLCLLCGLPLSSLDVLCLH